MILRKLRELGLELGLLVVPQFFKYEIRLWAYDEFIYLIHEKV